MPLRVSGLLEAVDEEKNDFSIVRFGKCELSAHGLRPDGLRGDTLMEPNRWFIDLHERSEKTYGRDLLWALASAHVDHV